MTFKARDNFLWYSKGDKINDSDKDSGPSKFNRHISVVKAFETLDYHNIPDNALVFYKNKLGNIISYKETPFEILKEENPNADEILGKHKELGIVN